MSATYSQIGKLDLDKVKSLVDEGLSNVEIARHFGVDQHTVGRAVVSLGISRWSSFAKNKDSPEYKEAFIKDCIRVYKEQGALSHRIYKEFGNFYYKDINTLFGSIANLIDVVPELHRCKFNRMNAEEQFFIRLEKDFGLKPLYRKYKGFSWLKSDKGFMEIDAVYDNPCLFGIEYDDPSHFSIFRGDDSEEKLTRRKYLDDLKNNLCRANNFPLIRFAYNETFSLELLNQKLKVVNLELKPLSKQSKNYSLTSPVSSFSGLEVNTYGKTTGRLFFQQTIEGKKVRKSKRTPAFKHPLLAAIVREKWLLDDLSWNCTHNNISIETLKSLGFNSWENISIEQLKKIDEGVMP